MDLASFRTPHDYLERTRLTANVICGLRYERLTKKKKNKFQYINDFNVTKIKKSILIAIFPQTDRGIFRGTINRVINIDATIGKARGGGGSAQETLTSHSLKRKKKNNFRSLFLIFTFKKTIFLAFMF